MKSAYELAMERLEKAEPATAPLSAEQKKELARLTDTYKAKIAEREVFLMGKLKSARMAGKNDEEEQLQRELREEKIRLEEEREEKAERIRSPKRK